jgi:hypothetical protein
VNEVAWGTHDLGHLLLPDLLQGRAAEVPGVEKRIFLESLTYGMPLRDIWDLGRYADFRYVMRFDWLPINQNQVDLIILTNVRGRIRRVPRETGPGFTEKVERTDEERANPKWSMIICRGSPNINSATTDALGTSWVELDRLTPAFTEPFRVLARRNGYYFLTDSGRLYRTGTRRVLTGRRDIEPIWDDKDRPVTHYLTDTDADRTFLFTKPAKPGELGVFFELSDKPEPKPYDLSKINASKAEEPLKGALERARFLADQKLLKQSEPPKGEKKP